jgi:hypothetical protein
MHQPATILIIDPHLPDRIQIVAQPAPSVSAGFPRRIRRYFAPGAPLSLPQFFGVSYLLALAAGTESKRKSDVKT